MPKDEIAFEDFLLDVNLANLGFVNEFHEYMLQNGCKTKIEAAKSGNVLSYLLPKTKKVILNYVFRKNGMIIRIYGDNISKYEDILKSLPANMAAEIEKAPECKRLIDPAKCNSRCPLGYVFDLNGKTHKNCRYSSFMFEVKEENYDSIRDFIKLEIKERLA